MIISEVYLPLLYLYDNNLEFQKFSDKILYEIE